MAIPTKTNLQKRKIINENANLQKRKIINENVCSLSECPETTLHALRTCSESK